ncbi:hypothetical protein QFC20_002920 [Naganishia adeliensis]|uniref:Uncharacterized protein n=1 Tax=Naganishia adeliensis TaxID=92952 RepID=A0ACC2WFP7_9TREE|nr:hypothetical protein QFC20_002920 [Naganishia adeliensis]
MEINPSDIRIPDAHKNTTDFTTTFLDLPEAIQQIYLAAIRVPKDFPGPEPPRDLPVRSFQTLPKATTTDSSIDYAFTDDVPDSLPPTLSLPPSEVLWRLTAGRAEAWTEGMICVWVYDNKGKTVSHYPLWALEVWTEGMEMEASRQAWEEGIAFISKIDAAHEGVAQPTCIAELRDRLPKCGWNASLFRKKINFDYETLSIVPLLHETRWASKTAIDCGLISLRARYHSMQDRTVILSSEFSGRLRLGNPSVNTTQNRTYHDSVYNTAAWLSEDFNRSIISIVFVDEGHWAAVRLDGRGTATVVDSLHEVPDSFPRWWSRKGRLSEDWGAFARLIRSKITFNQKFVSRGYQDDGSSCGSAALNAMRWFLDNTTPQWDSKNRSVARVELVLEIMKAREVCAEQKAAMSRGQVVSLAKPDSTAVVKGTSTSDVLLLLKTGL